jgi:hypothetical protein
VNAVLFIVVQLAVEVVVLLVRVAARVAATVTEALAHTVDYASCVLRLKLHSKSILRQREGVHTNTAAQLCRHVYVHVVSLSTSV